MSCPPPEKKACLNSSRGKKNETLHSIYEKCEGGKLRCKLCYRQWFCAVVEHAVKGGTAEDEARLKFSIKTPPAADVPSFHPAGTASMKRHLFSKHSSPMKGPRGFVVCY